MKPILFLSFSLLLFSIVSAQPQQILIKQLTVLEYSHFTEIKGRFISEDNSGDAYYECTKKLLGFTTMILQHNGEGKMVVRAVPNDNYPRPPVLEKLMNQLDRSVGMLGIIKKDSDTDGPLKEYLKKFPKIQRIIVYAEKENHSTLIYIGKDDSYMIDIENKY